MKKLIVAALAALVLSGCVDHRAYCDLHKREAEAQARSIALCSQTEGCETDVEDFDALQRTMRAAEYQCALADAER